MKTINLLHNGCRAIHTWLRCLLAVGVIVFGGSVAKAADGSWENLSNGVLGQLAMFEGVGGVTIAGYVRKPAGVGPFPMVIVFHGGGSKARDVQAETKEAKAAEAIRAGNELGRSMNSPIPDFLAQGWAVYAIDFRPSSHHMIDPMEFDDTVIALNKARAFPFVDPQRIAMWGGSHGGHVTGRMLSRFDLCCAVLCAPAGVDLIELSHLATKGALLGGNQMLIRQMEESAGVKMADIEKNPEKYHYSSLLTEVPKVRCPILMISGRNDNNAPLPVVNLYVDKLRAAGKEVQTYQPDNGPHGFYSGIPQTIPETAESTRRTVAFIKRHFAMAGPVARAQHDIKDVVASRMPEVPQKDPPQQTNAPSTYNPPAGAWNNKKFDLKSYKGTIRVKGDVIQLVTADGTYVVRSPMMRPPGQGGGVQASKPVQGGNMQGTMKDRIDAFFKDLKAKDGSQVELRGSVRNFNGENVLLVLPGGGRGLGAGRQGAPGNQRSMPQPEWLEPDHTAPNGTQYKTFHSKTLNREVSYLIWLPPGYAQSTNRYPVIYWLYGSSGRQFGGATIFLPHVQEAIQEGVLPPVIVVSVNGMMKSFYCDSTDGQCPMESVIIKDLIPHVDVTYRTVAQREGRVVEGFSMGGYGAGHLGFKYPEIFGTVVINSGALVDPALADFPPIFVVFGHDDARRVAEHPRELARKNADQLKNSHIRIGCGSRDGLLSRNQDLHEVLTQLGIKHEFEIVPDVAHESDRYYEKLGTKVFEFHHKSLAAVVVGH